MELNVHALQPRREPVVLRRVHERCPFEVHRVAAHAERRLVLRRLPEEGQAELKLLQAASGLKFACYMLHG